MKRSFNVSRSVFVIGYSRSGTTWFANLINSHPNTVYRHEAFGRDYRSFGDALFRKLKFDHGLSDEDMPPLIRVLMEPKVDTDKPPFFRKPFYRISSTTVRKLIWLAAKASPILAPLYALLFTPSPDQHVVLVLKETGSGVNLGSIITGTRPDKLIVLVRHPYGVIASHVSGSKIGVMSESTPDLRREWLKCHSDVEYVRNNRITEDYILKISEVGFLAISWRVRNDQYLRICTAHPDSRVVIYEAFLRNVLGNTLELLGSIGLEPDDQVFRFVQDSSSSETFTNVLRRDASSSYFSVFRGKGFDTKGGRMFCRRKSLISSTLIRIPLSRVSNWTRGLKVGPYDSPHKAETLNRIASGFCTSVAD